jgi:4-carboxymuconolactone decarboxylase
MAHNPGGKENPNARYERGIAKMAEMFGDRGRQTIASLDGIAPDLGRYLAEFVFGDILSRPGLDLKSREIATVAALTALGTAAPQLRAHMHGALNAGCSQQEIIEIVMQMAVYAGFPAALNGIQAAKEVFAERAARSNTPGT